MAAYNQIRRALDEKYGTGPGVTTLRLLLSLALGALIAGDWSGAVLMLLVSPVTPTVVACEAAFGTLVTFLALVLAAASVPGEFSFLFFRAAMRAESSTGAALLGGLGGALGVVAGLVLYHAVKLYKEFAAKAAAKDAG